MAQPHLSDCISTVHCAAPQVNTSLAEKSITHLSGDFWMAGVTSHDTTVSAGSSLMLSHCLRRPRPNQAPHHSPAISWNRIPVAASSVHTEALANSGVVWDLRFVARAPSPGGSVSMYWPRREAGEAIWRMMLRPWGMKLVGPLSAELEVREEGPWDDPVVVDVPTVVEDGPWDDSTLEGSSEVGAGMLVGSSDVEGSGVAAVDDVLNNPLNDVRTMVEKDPVPLV